MDGIGLGEADAAINPFLVAHLPVLTALLGGRLLVRDSAPAHAAHASLVAVDATLGFDGTPQSGTGQASLLTGVNAVAVHGRHHGPWVPSALRKMVREESVLADAAAAGHSVAFANAYPEEVLALVGADGAVVRVPSAARPAVRRPAAGAAMRRTAAPRRRTPGFLHAGPPLAALGAGLLTRHTPELQRGDAVASEITNDGWRERLGRTELPVIDARRAGRNLARITRQHDLTLFAHYATDYAGHERRMDVAVDALERLDAFIGGITADLPPDALLFLVSDHGNLEDVRCGHTRNPAVGLVIGEGHALLARRLAALTDVAPTVMDALAL